MKIFVNILILFSLVFLQVHDIFPHNHSHDDHIHINQQFEYLNHCLKSESCSKESSSHRHSAYFLTTNKNIAKTIKEIFNEVIAINLFSILKPELTEYLSRKTDPARIKPANHSNLLPPRAPPAHLT
ncbi:MAG TPA: hypothetical protein PLG90_02130 [Ignavibacteria bacterium]|nr:hypothetical protein [Ignavibacteria bacterium]